MDSIIRNEVTIPVIDMEHHFYTPDYLERIEGRSTVPSYNKEKDIISYIDGKWMPLGFVGNRLLELAEDRLSKMDAAGITTALLQCSPGTETLPGTEGIELCRAVNRRVFEVTQEYPGRFFGMATLPVREPEEAVRELETCVKEYGFVGWHTHSNYGETHPDDDAFLPIFQTAAKLGAFVYIHPAMPIWSRLNDLGIIVSAGGLGFTVDTMTTLTALIARGVFEAAPGLKIVAGHFGESLPFLLERMDTFFNPKWKDPSLKNAELPSYYFKNNIMVTTSGNMSAETFCLTKDVLGIDRIMVGTDYPYESPRKEMEFLSSLALTPEEREILYHKNAEALIEGIS